MSFFCDEKSKGSNSWMKVQVSEHEIVFFIGRIDFLGAVFGNRNGGKKRDQNPMRTGRTSRGVDAKGDVDS